MSAEAKTVRPVPMWDADFDDLGALAVAISRMTENAGGLDEEGTRAVYVLSCMAVAAWRRLDAAHEAAGRR